MVRQYVVTRNDVYYPSGGLDNVVGDFDTRDQAEEFAELLKPHWDEVQVHDLHQEPPWRNGKAYLHFISMSISEQK